MYMLFNAITVYHHSSTDIMLAFAMSLTFFSSIPQRIHPGTIYLRTDMAQF